MATLEASFPLIDYRRVSDRGGRDGVQYISPSEQGRTNRLIAEREGHPLTDAFLDENESGSHTDRPMFRKMLKWIRDGKAAGVVVKNPSRFSRDPISGLQAVREIEDAGGIVVTEHGRLSVANPEDEFMTTLLFALERKEWHTKKNYYGDSVRNAIERGVHISVPYGYRRADGKGTPLVKDEREAPIVKYAFELRAKGDGWVAIAKRLNDEGKLPRPKPDGTQKLWKHNVVAAMIQNRVYLGVAWHGEFETKNAHPAIVTTKLFNRANKIRGRRSSETHTGSLLTGLVRCASCGYTMQVSKTRGRRYYTCKTNGMRAAACPAPVNVPADALEAYVEEWFEDELRALPTFALVVDDSSVQEAQGRLDELEDAYANALTEKARAGKLTKREAAIHDKTIDAIRDDLRRADDELRGAQRSAARLDIPADVDADSYANMSVERRRHFLSLVLAGVAVRRSAAWRESVDERGWIVLRRDAPKANDALIRFFSDLDFDERDA